MNHKPLPFDRTGRKRYNRILTVCREAAEKVDTTAYIWYNIIIKYRRWYHG